MKTQLAVQWNKTQLGQQVVAKLEQWDKESAINAARAIRAGATATLVKYPSGLRMMRFGEPYGNEYGARYEVLPEVWEALIKNGGKIFA